MTVPETYGEEYVRRLIEVSGFFDEVWYGHQYPELDKADLLNHYVKHGGHEGRSPGPLFNGGYYLDSYPDVRESGIHPLAHFILYGSDEGRLPAPHEPFM